MRDHQPAEYILYHIYYACIQTSGKDGKEKTFEQIKELVENYLFEVEREKRRSERAMHS
jgi:hypothetical protein